MPATDKRLVQRARFLAFGFSALFLLGWAAIFYPFNRLVDRFGTPLGGDFPMFYVAGQTVADGALGELYNDEAQQNRLRVLFPELAADYILPFRYPPTIAWLLHGLAQLNYPLAFAVFAAGMLVMWWMAAALLARGLKPVDETTSRAAWWTMIAWPVGWEAILGGQASPVALFIVAAVWWLLRMQRPVLAGGVLALAFYKPNVLAFFVLGCLIARPRMFWGAAVVWATAGTLTCWVVGLEGVVQYVAYGSRLALEPWQLETPYWKVQGLGTVLAPWVAGYERRLLLVVGSVLAVVIAWRWRCQPNGRSEARCVSALLVVNYLCNPYVPVYDLLTLMAAAAIAAQSLDAHQLRGAASNSRVQLLWLGLMIGPHLSQALARSIGWQIFPIALLLCGATMVLRNVLKCVRDRWPGQNVAWTLLCGGRESRKVEGRK